MQICKGAQRGGKMGRETERGRHTGTEAQRRRHRGTYEFTDHVELSWVHIEENCGLIVLFTLKGRRLRILPVYIAQRGNQERSLKVHTYNRVSVESGEATSIL